MIGSIADWQSCCRKRTYYVHVEMGFHNLKTFYPKRSELEICVNELSSKNYSKGQQLWTLQSKKMPSVKFECFSAASQDLTGKCGTEESSRNLWEISLNMKRPLNIPERPS